MTVSYLGKLKRKTCRNESHVYPLQNLTTVPRYAANHLPFDASTIRQCFGMTIVHALNNFIIINKKGLFLTFKINELDDTHMTLI